MHRVSILVFVGVLVFANSSLRADTVYNTVVVLHSGKDPMTVRLGAELEALGYRPVPVAYPTVALSLSQVQDIIDAHRAIALIDALFLSEKVDIWIVDPDKRTVSLVETVSSNQGDLSEASMFLKSVELLRARLMKIDSVTKSAKRAPEKEATQASASTAESDKPSASSENRRAAQRSRGSASSDVFHRRRLSMELGPSGIYGFSDLKAAFQLFLGARVRLTDNLGLDIVGFIPTFPLEARTSYGSAKVWNSAVASGLRVDLVTQSSRWVPYASSLVGLHMSRLTGKANVGYLDDEDRILVAVVFLSLGLDVTLSQRVALGAALQGGWTVKRPVVGIGEEKIPWGSPLLGGRLTLVTSLF